MDETGISYTEKEYDFAVAQNIPVLAFVRSDEENIPVRKFELDSEVREKLNRFKQKVGNEHHLNYWKSIDELKANVLSSLSMAFVTNPQMGWVKSDLGRNDLLKQLTELKREHNKLLNKFQTFEKSIKPSRQEIELSRDDDEITITVHSSSNRVELHTTWNKLFINIGKNLDKYGKVPEFEIDKFIINGLRDSVNESDVLSSDFWHYAKIDNGVITSIGNQLFAFDWIKISLDRRNVRHWTMTEKGRKVFVHQTGIYR